MSSKDPSPTGRRWLRRSAVALVAIGALYAGTAFVLSRFLDPEELAGWLEPRLETALNRDVAVGGVEVGFFPLAVRLQALDVSDPTGLAPELAHMGSLELRVKILPLLRREIQISRLVVDGLRAELRVSQEGRSNFGDFSTRPAAGADPGGVGATEVGPNEAGDEGESKPFSLNLNGVRLVNSQIQYGSAADSVEFGMVGLEARAGVRRDPDGGWIFVGSTNGEISFRQGEDPPLLDGAPLELAFDVQANGGFEDLTIRTGDIVLGQIALALKGGVSRLQDPVRNIALTLAGDDIPLPDLMALLPDSAQNQIPFQADGSVSANLSVEGELGPGHLPTVTGRVALTDGLVSRDGDRIAEGLNANLDLAPGNSIQSRTQATVLGGPFSLEGTTTLGADGAMDLVLRAAPELGGISSLVEFPDGISADGSLDVQLQITGPLNNFREARFRGNVLATGIQATHPALGVPLEVPNGEVQISGIRAIVQDLPLHLGADRALLSGELSDVFALLLPDDTPHFQGSIQGARLNLPELSPRPRPDPDLTYGKVAFAKVGDRPVGGGGFQAAAETMGLKRPESLPLGGSLEVVLDTVIDNQGRMENVRANMDFGPSFLEITDATFDRFGGEIRTALNLSLASSEAAPFSFSLDVRELDAGGFLSNTTPLGGFVRGTISLELDLIGTLDGFLLPDRPALVGSASFSLSDGGLNSTPLTEAVSTFLGMEALREPSIQDWQGSMVLEEGRVLLAEATIQGAPGSPEVGGRIGLNGELDLRSAFDLPTDRLSTAALDRLGVVGEIAANVAQRPEVVQAILRIGGSIADPAVEADPAAAAQTLGQAVEEEVRAEAQERIDAEKARAEEALEEQRAEAQRKIQEQKDQLQNRATGFLQDLMRPRETTPPDSAVPDTVGPDTVRADTLLPDTVGGDTIRPDTLGPDTLGPGTVAPDTLRPDTLRPDTVGGDTVRPNTIRPDTLPPGTALGWLGPSSPAGSPTPVRGKAPAPGPGRR